MQDLVERLHGGPTDRIPGSVDPVDSRFDTPDHLVGRVLNLVGHFFFAFLTVVDKYQWSTKVVLFLSVNMFVVVVGRLVRYGPQTRPS